MSISLRSLVTLLDSRYEGNVRELQNFCNRLRVTSDEDSETYDSRPRNTPFFSFTQDAMKYFLVYTFNAVMTRSKAQPSERFDILNINTWIVKSQDIHIFSCIVAGLELMQRVFSTKNANEMPKIRLSQLCKLYEPLSHKYIRAVYTFFDLLDEFLFEDAPTTFTINTPETLNLASIFVHLHKTINAWHEYKQTGSCFDHEKWNSYTAAHDNYYKYGPAEEATENKTATPPEDDKKGYSSIYARPLLKVESIAHKMTGDQANEKMPNLYRCFINYVYTHIKTNEYCIGNYIYSVDLLRHLDDPTDRHICRLYREGKTIPEIANDKAITIKIDSVKKRISALRRRAEKDPKIKEIVNIYLPGRKSGRKKNILTSKKEPH